MKKALQFTFGVIAIAATLTFQSCEKLKSAVTIPPADLTGATADITIPVTAAGTGGTLATVAFNFDMDSLCKELSKGYPVTVKYSNISSVKVSSMKLTLSDADATNNFGNFEIAGVTFNTDASGGSLQPYNVLYTENNPAAYASTFSPDVVSKDDELKSYFTGGKLNITYALTGKLRTATTHTLKCHVDVTYVVKFALQ